MGKRFVTRSRQEWEALLDPDADDVSEVAASARAWLEERLEGYVQSNPELPITIAVPDRFAAVIGDEASAKTADGDLAGRA
jgi:hypothetical protein